MIYIFHISLNYLFLILNLLAFSIHAQDKNNQSSIEFQQQLNVEFADSLKSPLTEEDRGHFKALDFFSIDKKYIVEAKILLEIFFFFLLARKNVLN